MKKPLVFLPTSLCAADTTVSESDLKELFQTCELLLTVRSKPMQLPTLLRKWKRDSWMRVLFSRTSKHFHIESFVTKLPSCQQVFHVSPSPVQGNEKQQKTHDTSTHSSQMELPLCDHDMCSSKMLKESSQQRQETESRYLNMSLETWSKEVTRVRGEYSVRLKSEHHTKGNESSYWGTPRETMSRDATHDRGKCNLGEMVHNPKNWATPQASDHVEGARTATESNQKCLGRDLARLDTQQDRVSNSTSGNSQGSWGTPASNDANKTPHCEINSKQAGLTKSVGIAEAPQIGGKLNPAWVCQLMGLPSGWTNLGSWATE